MKLTPKGMRDIPPDQMLLREEAIYEIKRIFRKYGYMPVETPALEYLETLRAKAGDDADEQIFVVRGNKYGLRFDLTVPFARYAANTDNPKPFKRYSVERVWRKEEPQRGRFREFWQADIDVVGSPSMRSEAELLLIAREICISLGFDKPRIMINNRKILDAIAKELGFSDKKTELFRALDKIDKVGPDEVSKMLEDVLGTKAEELLQIINVEGDNDAKLALGAQYSPEGVRELEEIISLCDFEVEVSPFLVRGLGYYTGPVFEIRLHDDMGSVAGGGRYDNLLKIYGQDFPAVGISFGIERLITLMMEMDGEKRKTRTRAFVAAVKDEFYPNAVELASSLRDHGIFSETDLNERKLSKQLDYANSLGIPYVVILGKKEISSNTYNLRDMKTGKEKMLNFEGLLVALKG